MTPGGLPVRHRGVRLAPAWREGSATVTDSETSDGWISLADAAAALGLSVHAVRRRVRQGTLPARRVQTRYGPAWLVQLDGACDGRATVAPPSRDPDAHPSATVADEWMAGDLVDLVPQWLSAHAAPSTTRWGRA